MKRIPFSRRPMTHSFKRPHSKAEEPDPARAGFRRNSTSIMITTQSPSGEGKRELFLFGQCDEKRGTSPINQKKYRFARPCFLHGVPVVIFVLDLLTIHF
jgi:hypothetical protein